MTRRLLAIVMGAGAGVGVALGTARAEMPRIVEIDPVEPPPARATDTPERSAGAPTEESSDERFADRARLNTEPPLGNEEIGLERIEPLERASRDRDRDRRDRRDRVEPEAPSAVEMRMRERQERQRRQRIQERLRRVMELGRTRQ